MAIQPNTRPLVRGALPAADRARLAQAQDLQQQGRLAEAEVLLRQLLQRHTASFDVLHAMGLLAAQFGRHEDAVQLLRAALMVDGKQADALVNLGRALQLTAQHDAAMACIDMALELDANDDDARLQASGWLLERGQAAQAARLLTPMLAPMLETDTAQDGQALLRNGRAALALGRLGDALRAFEQAHALGVAPPPRSHGSALLGVGRLAEALTVSQQWVTAEPASADAWNLHGAVLLGLGRAEQACECFGQALRMDAGHRPAVNNIAHALQALNRHEDAALALERLLALWPEGASIKGRLLHHKMAMCDWLNLDSLRAAVEQEIDGGGPGAEPSSLQAWVASPARLQRAARAYLNPLHAGRALPPFTSARAVRGSIRLGYVSADFTRHAHAAELMQLLRAHSRERFDVFVFDGGTAVTSAVPAALQSVATVVPIGACSDEQAASLVAEREIDILVHLDGASGRSRIGLFAFRPAPVQVSWLGSAGTLGVPFIDYLVADSVVVPAGDQVHFDEAIVHMPHASRPVALPEAAAGSAVKRSDHGLPEGGVVFCNFDAAHRITPEVFSVWMNLLAQVPGSVLWLPQAEEATMANLVAEAQWRGVEGARLVFAPPCDRDSHLSRLALADLMLDTLPCNALIAGVDALAAGVPLLTCTGSTFAGRASASLLSAVGLEGLITRSLPDYEALALHLASTPAELAQWRQRLAQQRTQPHMQAPLFDTGRYALQLESAYEAMAHRARLGLAPAAIAVGAAATAMSNAPHALTPRPNEHTQVALIAEDR